MTTNADARPGSRDRDAAAVLSALGQDLDAGFEALFRTYRGVVFTSALRICGRRADAEDLTAEAFLRAYRALSAYDHARIEALRPRPWLLAILLNVWRNHRRSMSRRPSVALPEGLPERPDPGEGMERVAERRETGQELAPLLAHLPDAQRSAVVLRHVCGLSIGEVAAVLGCPEGTAKSHVSRGLARLRSLWTGGNRP